jgi:hypothetical protein
MASRSRAGNSYKTQYKLYKDKGSWRKNKIRKLERRVLDNPNDTGAEKALENFLKTTTQTYGRAKPGIKGWFQPQEQKFLKMANSDDPKVVAFARDKLAKIRAVYADKRPSAVRMKESNAVDYNKDSVVDKFYEVGLINEKRKESLNTRMDRVRKR